MTIWALGYLTAVACGDEQAPKGYVRGLVQVSERVYRCLFTSDGKRLLVLGPRWNYFQAVPPYARLEEHPVPRGYVHISPDQQKIYVAEPEVLRVLRLDDMSTERQIPYSADEKALIGIGGVISDDGKFMASGAGRDVYVRDAETLNLVSHYRHGAVADNIAFFRFVDNSKKLIVAWTKTADYEPVATQLIDVATGTATRFPFGFRMFKQGRGIGAVSPDGKTVALGNLTLVDAQTLEPRWQTSAGLPPGTIAFSRDGRWILLNGHPSFRSENDQKEYVACAFRVVDAATGKLLLTMPVDTPGLTPPTPMTTFTFSPDGRTLATCSHDPEQRLAPIVLWDWEKIETELLVKAKP